MARTELSRVGPPLCRLADARRSCANLRAAMSTLSMSDFEVVSFLGKGTTGSVYKVRRRADGALLVVKAIMLTGYSEVQRREIINEVTVMSRASHPNVIAYEGSFVERDTLHIVMELAIFMVLLPP